MDHCAMLLDELVHPPITRSSNSLGKPLPVARSSHRAAHFALTLGCGRRSALGPIRAVLSPRLSLTSLDRAYQTSPRPCQAPAAHGFGVLTTIDVKDTLQKKLGVGFRRYTILGACNPELAYQALTAEPQIGLLLPCSVVVQEGTEGGIIVSSQDTTAMFSVVDNPALKGVADEVGQRLRRVMASIG